MSYRVSKSMEQNASTTDIDIEAIGKYLRTVQFKTRTETENKETRQDEEELPIVTKQKQNKKKKN